MIINSVNIVFVTVQIKKNSTEVSIFVTHLHYHPYDIKKVGHTTQLVGSKSETL